MLSLANFAMQSRRNAILLAVLFALIPLMGWVADIIMALVTLRRGAKEGAVILMWIMLPSLVLALRGYPQFLLYNALAGSVITYVFALVLRHSMNWSSVVQAALIIGVIEVMALHLVLPNLDADWARGIMGYLNTFRQQLALQAGDTDMRYWADMLGKIITGLQITIFFIYDLVILGLARYVQARLYNPAGLRPELCNIRLTLISIVIFALALMGSLSGNEMALDCLFLTAMPFIVAGISLTHYMAGVFKLSGFWFIGFYGLLILFFPYVAVVLAVFALADTGLNFRQRYKFQ